uniref:Putative salivary lipocalin n=1 Tax=Ixodes ricinus TaxID=34613 RepID=A0A0K8R7G6_IXORI
MNSYSLTLPQPACKFSSYIQKRDRTVFSELWVHYKESDRKRHVEQIKLKYKDPSESGIGNTLFFQFPKPVYNGLISKDVEFQVREHNLCYSLKATLSDRCFIIVLPTISGDSRANDCVPTAELAGCQYENYKVSEDFGCLDYETVLGVPEVTDSVQKGVKEAASQGPFDDTPLDESNQLLQRYQDFPKGLLFSSLVLVQSSLKEDPSRLCMIMYRPNENPPEHGKLYMLTTYTAQEDFIAQTFHPRTVDGHDNKYKTRAELYRNGKFYETTVIFTDRKRCTILRTPGYHNLCELFTAGPYTKGSLNNYCFFIYNMYCKEPATTFTKLGDCWPPARQPNP